MATADIDELESRARTRLAKASYDYIAGGVGDERTVAANLAAWAAIALRPHVLHDVGTVDPSTTVLGTRVSAPVLVAPSAMHGLVCDEAEAATARAAAGAGTVMALSLAANLSMETVAAAAPGAPRWFQTYMHKDRGFTAELTKRAAAAGYSAIVLSVDAPVAAPRRRDLANRFAVPVHLDVPNMTPSATGDAVDADLLALAGQFDPTITFDDLHLIPEWCGLPVVVKGLVRGDDARQAIDSGAAAVVVSNHGGRELDGSIATARALPEVIDAVNGRGEVLVDGGIRNGADILRAVAIGARAVLVGRPVLWGLANGGEEGALGVLSMLMHEFADAMALCGVTNVDAIDPDLLALA